MQSADTVLGVLRERGRQGLPLERLYRQLFNEQLFLVAYGRIYANDGAMTAGVDGRTPDGMGLGAIRDIIDRLRAERYQFAPVRRVWIPKKNGTRRPLGLPAWSDKLVGEVVRLLLEAYYEPRFSARSHGFRPGRGCHTALDEIASTWTGTTWFIEGDIADCFGSLDHEVLLAILGEHIHDQRFLHLVGGMLRAGYVEDWTWHATHSGAPQGGVITPPTQWAMFGIVTLCVAAVGVVAGAVYTFSDGDAVSDGDLLRADENVLDEQSQHALAFFDGGDLGVGVQLGEEAFEVGGELEVGPAVGELVVQRLDLVAQVGFAGAQVGHAAAELVDGDQVLAEGLDHVRDGGAGLGEGGLQPLPLTDGRVAVAGGVESFVDLGPDELWVGQQLGDVVPHDRVEVVGADRLFGAGPARSLGGG